ncbi:hydrolase [Salinimicrobium tongyeongense]|jgi:hydroxymethylpyrimidine pyrophosphatase-like HAD family hydrolase|uniref:Hydrolase n=1 Tax=Salinimicrobium tongyeongense TaxID=2809707 RepID=A0ABY6NSL1_9FLAO|nr:hydrolase [Salinimicrobium tongyeongense]UZH55895.1 hydrolase [Salinimicrobium tongyeongense]
MPKMLTIAVDFDGTLVENRYPEIGKPILFAFETLQKLQQEGHQIILWTYRSGVKLQEAVDFCKSKGIRFYAVNRSYPEEEFEEGHMSRKILADLFIDDRNINGLPPWGEIYHQLSENSEVEAGLPKKENKLLRIFKKL